MSLRVRKDLLIHQFDYYEFESEDVWQKATYEEPITIKNTRIDGNIIFVYASDTTPFIEFKRRSKIVTSNGTFMINNITKIDEPFTNKIWSVELELI